jgi:ACS family sodium-dependent inorganic phosphate cotransporter/ACS family sodium-dependent inorganic phosphate cotransporter-like MFS transporter 9
MNGKLGFDMKLNVAFHCHSAARTVAMATLAPASSFTRKTYSPMYNTHYSCFRPFIGGCNPRAAHFCPTRAAAAQAVAVISATAAEAGHPSSSTFLRTVIPTALALLLCNMDRICLSVAMLPIAKELGWAEGVQGIVQSAFLWGYLANQLLGGALADKFGGKKVMAAGIIFFSLASALLPLVAVTPLTAALGITLPAVLAVRFLVGFGEGVALPSMNNLIATRIVPTQRATALGICFMGFHTGSLVGLLISPLILYHLGWKSLFYIFGLFGAPLLALWSFIVPNLNKNPSAATIDSPTTTTTSTAPSSSASTTTTTTSAAAVSLGAMLKNRAVWAIIVANFANHWGYFIYLNWMPTYFYKVLGMDLRASSFMSFLPWLVMAAGSSFSGIISDALVRSGTMSPTAVRKSVQTIAFLGSVVPLLVLAAGGLTPSQAVAAMTMALGITSLGQFVTNMSDVAPRHAGRLFGLCNTFGSFAGILGVSVAGLVVEQTGSFALVFQITAALNIIGTVVWNMFATAEKQFD